MNNKLYVEYYAIGTMVENGQLSGDSTEHYAQCVRRAHNDIADNFLANFTIYGVTSAEKSQVRYHMERECYYPHTSYLQWIVDNCDKVTPMFTPFEMPV